MYVHSYQRRWFQFCVLAGVKDVHLGRDGSIKGRWWRYPGQKSLDRSPSRGRDGWPETLVQDFANWGREPQDVRRFTERYGPLTLSAEASTHFRLEVADWLKCQDSFRAEWADVMLLSKERAPLWLGTELPAVPGERFEFVGDAYSYITANLYRLLLLELRCIDRRRLRTCARPNCPNPYFVASHLKQTYCSEPCAQWGQGEAKRRWWREKGDPERRRRATTRGKSAGRRKK